MTQDEDAMGPVGYLVVEFPENRMGGKAFPILVDLVDRGVIRILDLVFLRKDVNGGLAVLTMADVDHDGDLDVLVFDGASSGLLSGDDLVAAGSVVERGATAGILVYENRWATPFVSALRDTGAQLISAGYIPLVDVAASLDQLEMVAR